MPRYSPALEAQMRMFYQSLSEKDRRRDAAIEACKLGRGGLSYIARVLSCDRHPIAQGMQELTDPEALKHPRLRHAGGGRKPRHEVIPELDTAFLQVLEAPPAGSPMHAAVTWPNLTHREIADRLAADHGLEVRVTVVTRLLRQPDFVRRTAQKRLQPGECVHREAPFAQSARLQEDSLARGAPVISMDTKTKR